jgi:hypothetical protein
MVAGSSPLRITSASCLLGNRCRLGALLDRRRAVQIWLDGCDVTKCNIPDCISRRTSAAGVASLILVARVASISNKIIERTGFFVRTERIVQFWALLRFVPPRRLLARWGFVERRWSPPTEGAR